MCISSLSRVTDAGDGLAEPSDISVDMASNDRSEASEAHDALVDTVRQRRLRIQPESTYVDLAKSLHRLRPGDMRYSPFYHRRFSLFPLVCKSCICCLGKNGLLPFCDHAKQ